jgi:hypothetical protein
MRLDKKVRNPTITAAGTLWGMDIPPMGDTFADVCLQVGIKAVIIFPMTGPAAEKAFIETLFQKELVPWAGGRRKRSSIEHPEASGMLLAPARHTYSYLYMSS